MGLCVSVLKEAKDWGGLLMNRRTGLLLCSPHCLSFPSCFASPLTELFTAFWFGARSLTRLPTATHLMCVFFFSGFPLLAYATNTAAL